MIEYILLDKNLTEKQIRKKVSNHRYRDKKFRFEYEPIPHRIAKIRRQTLEPFLITETKVEDKKKSTTLCKRGRKPLYSAMEKFDYIESNSSLKVAQRVASSSSKRYFPNEYKARKGKDGKIRIVRVA